jgi:hypothetical protein
MLGEPLANFPGGTAYDRVLIGVIVRLSLKDFYSERALLQPIKSSVERSVDDMAQKAATFFTSAKLLARQETLQLGQNLFLW